MKILICGGGIAGPAAAYWLSQRGGHRVVIVERAPSLRASGAQIDLRGQGIEVARRMGLLPAIRGALVDEAGVSFVDARGAVRGTVLANRSGRGAQSLTSEYEIMRGDLVRILHEATREAVEYRFGVTVERFERSGDGAGAGAGVAVRFSDGSADTFDLLVGADGQGSRVRRAMLPPGAPDPLVRLGIHMAYWFVPRIEGDDNIRRTYHSPGGRMIMRRTHNATETQVYFILKDASSALSSVPRAPQDQQLSLIHISEPTRPY